MEQEVWKPIILTDGHYSISNKGRVRSNNRIIKGKNKVKTIKERILKPYTNLLGYHVVNLYKDKVKLLLNIHRLVAIEFLENPNNYNVVNHKDSNPLNNQVENLEWCTQKYNMQHAASKGRMGKVKGEDSHLSKLYQYQVNEIRRLTAEGKLSFRKIGKMYNCTHGTVSNINSGKTW